MRGFFACPAPVKMVCGSVQARLALLPLLPVWNQSLAVLGVAASPPNGCATMRMTAAMARMKSAPLPAPQTSSAVPARQGESKLTLTEQLRETFQPNTNNWH